MNLEGTNDVTTYERGCIKPPFEAQECSNKIDQNGQKIETCICNQDECNGVSNIVPLLGASIFSLVLLMIAN